MRKKTGMLVLILGMLMLAGCSKGEKQEVSTEGKAAKSEEQSVAQRNQGKILMTINGEDVSYEEYRLYLQSNKEEIEQTYGKDIWAMAVDEEGTTYEDKLKESVLDQITYIKLVCSKASELGIELTEDELLDVDEYTSNYLSEFSQEAMNYYVIDKDTIREIYKDNVLANKVYESLTLNVDTNVSEDEARQGIYQYILIGKYAYDDTGKRIEYTKEQLDQVKEKAQKVYQDAIETSDFKNLAMSQSDDKNEVEITIGKGDMKEELEGQVLSLKKGETSQLLDTEDGYFIFHCVEEKDQEATDAKKEEIIKKRQDAAFDQQYGAWNKDKEVEINDKLYQQISLRKEIVE